MRGCMRHGRTKELLCGNEQMSDRLFYLRKLLLGLHLMRGQRRLLGVGRGTRRESACVCVREREREPTYILGRAA
jgi:hypothetical protein